MNTMNTNVTIKRGVLGVSFAVLLALGMIGGATLYAQENTEGQAGVTFPVAELGGCADKAACKAYCDDGEHMDECVAFAQAHGLMNKEEADRSTKFAATVKAGNGPGGCTSPLSCKAYCEDLTHLDECMSFAEKNDFKGEEYKQGKQMSAYLKQGGKMPGGCTSRQSCEAYCGDFSNAEECFTFAKKAGIEDGVGDQKNNGGSRGAPDDRVPTPEQFKKLSELAKNGETPGGCTSKDSCDAYCHVDEHFDECAAFGEKVGFMSKEEGEQVRKMRTEGGPGGCKSPDACRVFCDNEANRETCFKFAEENGLIPPEELARMKEGMIRMRQGIQNAPEEVQACLKTVLGENVLLDLQSGKFVPGPEIGEKMRTCFEKFGGSHDPRDILKNAPPKVEACLKEKLGENFAQAIDGKTEPTSEAADTFRMCFQEMQFEQQGWGNDPQGMEGTMGRGQGGPMNGEGAMQKPDPDMFKQFLRSAPPEVVACIKEQLGEDAAKIESGELIPTPEVGQKLHTCFGQFRPASGRPPEMTGRPEGQEGMKGMPTGEEGGHAKFPPEVKESNLG